MGKSDETSEENKEEQENSDTEKKQDAESLRKVIKVDQKEDKKEESSDNESEKKEEKPEKKEASKESKDKSVSLPGPGEGGGTREALEQKRAILQNIKDFDFQIKKNQEEISTLTQKLESMSKDLDDLVSLYEIVSEQMNPFVGLSKVTKKRLDALENFTREIDTLKERTSELESFAEKSGGTLKNISEVKPDVEKIDADKILTEEKEEDNVESSDETDEVMTVKADTDWSAFSDRELDRIIEQTLGGASVDTRIDMMIDDFIENLKG
jgi:archaeal flagellar protein FlaC